MSTEEYQGEQSRIFPRMTTEARHVADGMLRLIAILAETQTEHRVLLFDIPSVAEKLTVMGPGEAFADTDLTTLHDEIETVTGGR